MMPSLPSQSCGLGACSVVLILLGVLTLHSEKGLMFRTCESRSDSYIRLLTLHSEKGLMFRTCESRSDPFIRRLTLLICSEKCQQSRTWNLKKPEPCPPSLAFGSLYLFRNLNAVSDNSISTSHKKQPTMSYILQISWFLAKFCQKQLFWHTAVKLFPTRKLARSRLVFGSLSAKGRHQQNILCCCPCTALAGVLRDKTGLKAGMGFNSLFSGLLH